MNPLRKLLIGGAMAGTALVGGAIGASLIGTAKRARRPPPPRHDPVRPGATRRHRPRTPHPRDPRLEQGRSPGQRQDRDPPHRRHLAKATAAAEAAVPGATAQRAETDAEGAAYEVHMTKSDGSVVTVKLDASFNVTSTVDGMG